MDGFTTSPEEMCTLYGDVLQLRTCCSWRWRNQQPSLEPILEANADFVRDEFGNLLDDEL